MSPCSQECSMYEGRTAAQPGITFGTKPAMDRKHSHSNHNTGHENMGVVEDIGQGVTLLKQGDRVVMPFNVADGTCRNCCEGKTAFCTGVNPGFAGGAYGQSLRHCIRVNQLTCCRLRRHGSVPRRSEIIPRVEGIMNADFLQARPSTSAFLTPTSTL